IPPALRWDTGGLGADEVALVVAMTPGSVARSCECALVAAARGAGTRQQLRSAARAFVRRHRRDVGYLAWVVRSVGASSALAIALLGLATDPATAKTAPFEAHQGSSNPFNNYDVGDYSVPAFGDLDGDGDFDVLVGARLGGFSYFRNTG